MKKNNSTRLKQLVATIMLAAIVVIVSFFPLKTLGLEINFSMVPVVIGGILFGPAAGAILGAVFGIVSFLQCFGYSAFGTLLIGENILSTIIVCVPTRILAGLIPALVAKYMLKGPKAIKEISYPVASILAPVLNTVFFMSALVLFFYNGDTVQYYAELLGAANPFVFIILFVGINGIVEILAGFIIAYPVSRTLKKALKL